MGLDNGFVLRSKKNENLEAQDALGMIEILEHDFRHDLYFTFYSSF